MKKRHFSNYIVILAIAAVVIYSGAAVVLQFMGGYELSPTLTTCWFTFWGTELVSLAAIKHSKIKHGGEQEDLPQNNDVKG